MSKERESAETQTSHCPACDRPLKEIGDYPKIIIKDLTVSAIPTYILDRQYGSDVSEKVKEISKRNEVKDYLKKLSSVKGDAINFSDIKPDLPEHYNRNEEPDGHYKLGESYYLGLADSKVPNLARISVFKHINSGNLGWGFLEIAKLATIKYEGVLNDPRFTIV